MNVRWLNFHTPYACRDSGMCCSSGWPIPIERSRVAAVDEAIARDVIPLRVVPWLVADEAAPDDVAGTLALRDNGHCVFFEAGRPGCSIHAIKPSGCAHFPYVCLIDQRGVHVTLSHFCPTAASLLFEHSGSIQIVAGPVPVSGDLEGLDARDALPPVVSGDRVSTPATGEPPARLMSFDELSEWERDQVARARIGELEPDDVTLFHQARAAVPPPWSWPDAPDHLEDAWYSLVAPRWHVFEDVLTRYAAAKAFASWSLYLGHGTAAAEHSARIAAAVLRVETARQCRMFGQTLDRQLLTDGIRQADLLLVHYADQSLLASAAEADGVR